MTSTSKPNRIRGQSTGSEEARRKQSGDQHSELLDEEAAAPERPHRTDRMDEKKPGTGKRQDGEASS
jgi:hypothetical protein